MNYRHIYHAGNFADVFKHVIMLLALDYLHHKDKGLLLLDAFAGCGKYDLSSDKARKTNEYEAGIARLMGATLDSPDLRLYRDTIAPFYAAKHYPGSPLLLAQKMRPQDRLIANELHPDDMLTLQDTLNGFKNAKVTQLDAYESLRANLPPDERRGLILIDPPFERKDEFEMLSKQIAQWKKRFATGCYMIWYPIKASLPVQPFLDMVERADFNNTCIFEHHIKNPANPDGLIGCGMAVFNTPFALKERVDALAPELASLLNARIVTKTIEPAGE